LSHLGGGQIADYLQVLLSLSRNPQARRFSSSERIAAERAGGARAMECHRDRRIDRARPWRPSRLGQVCRPGAGQ